MATGSKNAKSQQLNARFPHNVVEDIDKYIEDGESRAQFIVVSVKAEIKRRQRKAKLSECLNV